ncbi:MAG: SH3 domain-containing protein [Lachnospiraceae bacterium]|jgi:SH3-like domain-containing protein|nr:SH3 domain-containing protein [Lachnospiraceae bacterium]
MENHHRHKRSFGDRLLDFVYDARDWAVDHGRIVLPVMLSVCVLITVLVGISLYRTQSSSAASSGEDASSGSSQTPLEQNAYSDVDALIKKYFDATADGDTETISGITQGLSDDDKLRIGVVGDYIDSYASVDVYTKPGPVDGSYICFVVTKVIFTGNSTEIPGMQTMYVCTDTDGSLYINENTQSASDTDYIKKVSLDDDVVDLNNKVTAEYNDLVASDSELSSFLNDLSSKIDVSVGEALASASSSGSSAVSGSTSDGTSIADNYVVAADTANVRTAASQDAEIIGKLTIGSSYQLLGTEGDWSKIDFNGTEGYSKSQYLTAPASSSDTTSENAGDTSTEAAGTDSSGAASSVKAKTNDTVNLRASASADSDKLNTLAGGTEVDVAEKGDEWTKVTYNGTTGYIKTTYLDFE